MTQRLRVVGWLRFASKPALTRALNEFAANEAPDYFARADWQLDDLEARIGIDRELPGDFQYVELPFQAMVRGAAHGYVDYFEEGNLGCAQEQWPVMRWACGLIDKKLMSPRQVGLVADDETLLLGGKLTLTETAPALSPIRLPFLAATHARQLEVGADAFHIAGTSLTASATITGPTLLFEDAILEAISAIAAQAKSGALTLASTKAKISVGVDGKRSKTIYARPPKVPTDPSRPMIAASDLV